jgi:cation-transporting ATPase F
MQDARTRPVHHELPVHDVVLRLETDPDRGLDAGEAARRLATVGRNVLPKLAQRGPVLRFLLQFHNPLIYVLLIAVQVAYLLNCRSLDLSMFRIGVLSNRWVLVGATAMLGLQLLFT